jgi:filamentous hemagglutinin
VGNINAGGNAITLTGANNFSGTVTATGNTIQLTDTDALTLGNVNASGDMTAVGAGQLSVTGNVTGQAVSLQGVGVTNTGSITGGTSVTIDAGSGLLDNSGGIVANSGPGTAPIVLRGDSMALVGGTVTGNAAPITLTTGTSGQSISLISGGGLLLGQAGLDVPTTTGGLTIGDALHTADITIGGTLATPAGSSGGFTINAGYDGAAGGSGRILDSGAGLLDVAAAVTLKAHGNIGDPGPAIAPVHVGNATSLSTLTEVGDIYIGKAGALSISGINGGGQVYLSASGPITQTGPMLNVGSLHAAVTGAGGITLLNDLNTVGFLYLDAPGALSYHQAANYTVAQATGNGMDFSSHGNLNLAAVITGGPLNIDAGSGDVSLSTTGAISITGPGKVLGRNLSFAFANAVNFVGGSNIVNPGVSNDLEIKASGNLLINAASLNITGGTTLAGAGQDLKNDVVIQAGGHLTINTTGDLSLSGGTSTTSHATAKAQASAFLAAGTMDMKVGGDFHINGGTANVGGGEANASAIVLIKSGKAIEVGGGFVLTGGTITGVGSKATALAVFDPELPLEIKTGGSVAVVGGSTPSSSPTLLASASILNAGPIKFTIGGTGNFTHPDPAVAVLLGPGIKAGLIVAGGKGSGLYDLFDNPVTSNEYPIVYKFTGGGAFTVITDMTGYANALIQSRAPLGVDESLLGYINYSINTETIAKGRRGAADQGNFKRKVAGQCS